MTIGIALKDKENNRIIIGSDKQITAGYDVKLTIPDKKHLTREVKIIDGYCNHIDTKQIHFVIAGWGFLKGFLEHSFEIPDMLENQNFIEYLYNDLLECFRNQLMDKKLLGEKNNKFDSECNILIIYDGEIYELDSNFGVNLQKEYGIAGSGWKVAIGSLYTNLHYHPQMDKKEIVKQAIITCGVNTVYCDTNVDITVIEL